MSPSGRLTDQSARPHRRLAAIAALAVAALATFALPSGPAAAEDSPSPSVSASGGASAVPEHGRSTFVLGVIKSDAFQMKRAEPVSTDDSKDNGQRR